MPLKRPRTLKLFQVCKHNGLPIITVINKWDRPGQAPLELLDEITEQIGLVPTPLFMPVGIAGDYRGLLRRGEDGAPEEYVHFTRTSGGSTIAREEIYTPDAALEREGAQRRACGDLEHLPGLETGPQTQAEQGLGDAGAPSTTALAHANALAVVGEQELTVHPGQPVPCLVLEG